MSLRRRFDPFSIASAESETGRLRFCLTVTPWWLSPHRLLVAVGLELMKVENGATDWRAVGASGRGNTARIPGVIGRAGGNISGFVNLLSDQLVECKDCN